MCFCVPTNSASLTGFLFESVVVGLTCVAIADGLKVCADNGDDDKLFCFWSSLLEEITWPGYTKSLSSGKSDVFVGAGDTRILLLAALGDDEDADIGLVVVLVDM